MLYIDTDFTPLNGHAQENVEKFRRYLSEKKKEGEIILCYRGEEEKSIIKRLTTAPHHSNINYVYDSLYQIGDKCRHFFMDKFNNEERDYLTSIDDCSTATLNFIFDKIKHLIKDKKLSPIIKKNCPNSFIDYFNTHTTSHVFEENISRQDNLLQKLALRDYYLYFLHVAGSLGIRKEAMLVSTTTNELIARGFAIRSMHKPKSRNKLVFHYFVPRPFEHYAIAPWTITHVHDLLRQLGLPTYNPGGLFPHQKEIAIKGALFPHFILGIKKLDTGQFITNPCLENLSEKDFEQVSKFGFNVDQGDFANQIKNSNFLKWVETDSEGSFNEYEI